MAQIAQNFSDDNGRNVSQHTALHCAAYEAEQPQIIQSAYCMMTIKSAWTQEQLKKVVQSDESCFLLHHIITSLPGDVMAQRCILTWHFPLTFDRTFSYTLFILRLSVTVMSKDEQLCSKVPCTHLMIKYILSSFNYSFYYF